MDEGKAMELTRKTYLELAFIGDDGARAPFSAYTPSNTHEGANKNMPAFVLKCRACNSYQTFLVHEDELIQLEKNPIVRQCGSCRQTTTWVLVRTERRGGHERRSGSTPRRRE
jgi:hypothetical protein